jgi:hypothetical protein
MKALLLLATVACTLFYSCGSKEKEKGSVQTLVDNEFTEQFSELKLSIIVADTTLDKLVSKEKTLKLFAKKYFPDSLIQTYFDRSEKVTFFPIGKAQNEDQEIYIVIKATSGTKRAAFLLVYDNQLVYKDGILICKTDADSKTTYSSIIDKTFDITIRKSETVIGGDPILTETFLAYNTVGKLGKVVTNDSEDDIDLTNPIDTLPQTKKFTGDYYIDKKNFISLRDSKDSGELVFFYHFEKEKNDCNGEIKDQILFTGPNTAAYMHDGEPCVMNLQFTGTQLILKEDHGCGNKRPLDCTLDGNFTKKASKPKDPKKADKKPVDPKVKLEPVQVDPKNTVKPPVKPKPKPKPKPITTPKAPVVNNDIQ